LEKTTPSETIGTLRSVLALFRDLAVLALLALVLWALFVAPRVFSSKLAEIRDALASEGIVVTEINAGVATIEVRELNDDFATIAVVQEGIEDRLNAAVDALKGARNDAQSPEHAKAIETAITRILEATEQVRIAQQSQSNVRALVSRTITDTEQPGGDSRLPPEPRVQDSPPPRQSPETLSASAPSRTQPKFVVVLGADKDLDAASYEVTRARNAGFDSAEIMLRDGWYRTALPFASLQAAEQALPRIRQELRSSSYIRSAGDWCSSLGWNADGKFWTCGDLRP
jgi:hypothetical protein